MAFNFKAWKSDRGSSTSYEATTHPDESIVVELEVGGVVHTSLPDRRTKSVRVDQLAHEDFSCLVYDFSSRLKDSSTNINTAFPWVHMSTSAP